MNNYELLLNHIYYNLPNTWKVFDYNTLTLDKRLTWEFFRLPYMKDISIEFNHNVSINPNITIDIILNNLNWPWDWYCLSQNPGIVWQNYIDNPTLPWDLDGLSQNPNITYDIIINNLNISWNWELLIQNINI